MNSFSELVKKSRSIRRFDETRPVARETLETFVDLVRYSPSAANRQPLKFFLSNSPDLNAEIFPCLGWAAYLSEWKGPAEGERPAAYIVILGDRNISENVTWDHSIASQTIMLAAAEKNMGGCIIGAIDRKGLHKALNFDEQYEILLVLALGYPAEDVVIEPLGDDGDIKYWRDEKGVHHVPKRALRDIIVN